MSNRVSVTVPATSGNIGPGFDVLGLALSLRNELHVRVLSRKPGNPVIRIVGEGDTTLPKDARNIVFRTIVAVFKKAKRPLPQLELVCVNRIPLTRGMGSSSAAYLAGLLVGNELVGRKWNKEQILSWATALEGHPDNVAPALLGGVKASGVFNGQVVTADIAAPKTKLILAIPEFELSTKKARKVLPKMITMKDAISNLSAVSLLPFAFQKNETLLKNLLNDRWHEPYRAKLIPGFYAVKKAALNAGALGVTLSGAGPTMLGFSSGARAKAVGQAMQRAFAKAGVRSRILQLSIDKTGAVVK